jgi:hypothetical protein
MHFDDKNFVVGNEIYVKRRFYKTFVLQGSIYFASFVVMAVTVVDNIGLDNHIVDNNCYFHDDMLVVVDN